MEGIIAQINKENLKAEIPQYNVGDTVRVYVKVVEGTKERLQAFEGVVIAKRHGGISVYRKAFVFRYRRGKNVPRSFPED